MAVTFSFLRPMAAFLALLSVGLSTQAQSPTITDALKLPDYLYVPEKLHLHFDRTQYSPGETIWFKAYLVQGGLAGSESKNLYVDFSDEQGKVLLHHISPMAQGGSSGSFTIPPGFTGTRLMVTGYTNWMRNADSAYLYQHTINIANNAAPKPGTVAPATRLYLLPEGGTLVEGLEQKIAFLAHDAAGKPVALKGWLQDKAGKNIDSVRTQFRGMGVFKLTPTAGNAYTVVLKDSLGKTITQTVPAATAQGLLLNITGTGEFRQFTVRRTEGIQPQGKYQLLATINAQAVYKANIDLQVRSSASGQIPVSALPSGVLVVTLFDASLSPIAERASFVNNDNFTIDAQLATVDVSVKKRGKNVLEMKYYDSIAAHYSIAVTDADLPTEKAQTIYSRLLLSGEVQGRIYQPAWYFSTYTDEAKQMLDLVMLTHGWRRYDWARARTGQPPAIIHPPDTAYMAITGKFNGGNPADYRSAKEMMVLMQTADSSRQLLVVPVAPDGRISIPDQLFFDTAKLYYQFGKNAGLTQKLNLQLDNGFVPTPALLRMNGPWQYTLPDTLGRRRQLYFVQEQEKLRRLMQTTTLEGVTVVSKKKSNIQVLDEKYANGMFSGSDGYSFDVQNDTRAMGATTVLQYLQGQVAGLQITGGNIGGSASVTWRGGAPGFFLDQMPVEVDQLLNIPMSDVAYIKVFRPPFMGGFNSANGAIAVYTQRGGDRRTGDDKAPSGMNKAIAVGYTARRIFIEPDYSTGSGPDVDVRPTLYWNPFVMADGKSRRSRLVFYNNDVSRRLRIVVEGINAEGQMVHIEKIIE